jgi:hypothetical protein
MLPFRSRCHIARQREEFSLLFDADMRINTLKRGAARYPSKLFGSNL